MNKDYYHEQNSCYDPNSFGFAQFQPPQYTVNHPIFNSQNKLMEQLTSIRDMVGQYIQKKEEENRIEEEQAAKDRYWKILWYEHLDTILEMESDELIKSSVENLVQILSESEDSSNESLLHRDTSINDSQKIDSLLDEFPGELTLPHSIPPGIDDVNLDPEGDILFLESLLYDNSSPRPPEEFNSENPTESFSPSPILVEDSNSLMEEIDIFLDGDGSIPPGIESDDFDSEDDDNSTSRPEFESFHVDYPDSGDSTIDVVEDIPVDVPNILPTHPALQLDFNFIHSNDLGSDLDDSSPSEDRNKICDPGICIKVEATRFLSTLSPVIDTLLPFSIRK
ncbi:hypothetical protein Tco_0015204 [Tanacetum coccineum]